MKKFLAIILCFAMVLSLCACGKKEQASDEKEQSSAPVASSFESVKQDDNASKTAEKEAAEESKDAQAETEEPETEGAEAEPADEQTDENIPDGIFEYKETMEGVTVLVRLTIDAKKGTAVMEMLTNASPEVETENYTFKIKNSQIIMYDSDGDELEAADYKYDGKTLILSSLTDTFTFTKVSKKTVLEQLSMDELINLLGESVDLGDSFDYEGESGDEPNQTLYSDAAMFAEQFADDFWTAYEFDETGIDSYGEYAEFECLYIDDEELLVYPYIGRIVRKYDGKSEVLVDNYQPVN